METQVGYVTEEEFWARYGNTKHRVELVDGEVVPKYGDEGPMSPTSSAHGRVVTKLFLRLGAYVEAHGLGEMFADPACFVISELPRRLRCPDVAFVRAGRAPEVLDLDGALRLAPDLAAEVVSRSEPASRLEEKVEHYLAAGVRLVWTVDPRRRAAIAYTLDGSVTRLLEEDALDGLDVVPGFRVPLAEVLAGVAGPKPRGPR